MAALDDLNKIMRLCQKCMNVTRSTQVDQVILDPNDLEGETQITVLNAQQQQVFNRRAAMIAEIKTLAAGLPSA